MNTKTVLASTLLTALIATTSANAGGRAADNVNYEVQPQSVEIKKVSLQSAQGMAGDLSVEVNSIGAQKSLVAYDGVNR